MSKHYNDYRNNPLYKPDAAKSRHTKQSVFEQARTNHDEDEWPPRYYNKPNSHSVKNPNARWKMGLIVSSVIIAASALATTAYLLLKTPALAQIIAVNPNLVTTQQAYQDCHHQGTYVRNHKDGTEGALIGGATGAVAGGIVGNQIHGGGGGTAVGVVAGGVGGALVGREIQRSNQPDYIARRTTSCHTAYKPQSTQVGYQVQYLYKDVLGSIITQYAPAIGSQLSLEQLHALALPTQQLAPPQ